MARASVFVQGLSLREIANRQNRPYSRIIYRLNCILKKLG
jgi:fimbrial protein FimY